MQKPVILIAVHAIFFLSLTSRCKETPQITSEYSNGYAIFESNGKSGIISTEKSILMKPKFDHVALNNNQFQVSLYDDSHLDFSITPSEPHLNALSTRNTRLRKSPSSEAKISFNLPINSKVRILDVSLEKQIIDSKGFYWVQIEHRKQIGWILTDRLSSNFRQTKDLSVWSRLIEIDGAVNPHEVTSYYSQKKQQRSFIVSATDIFFSGDARYMAIDLGSDTVGDIIFYDTLTFQKLFADTYNRAPITWLGSSVRYRSVYGKNCTSWIEKVFSNGRLNKTGKQGKGEPYCQ